MSAAEIIYSQLGAGKFKAMTGAKNFRSYTTNEQALSFQLPSRFAKNGINYVKITLEPSDTYHVKFSKIFKFKEKVIAEFSGIYADGLQKLFTEVTGLDTHL